jgi:hypothetical protein
MKLFRNILILFFIYTSAYLILPGPIGAVKKIDLATVSAWGVPQPLPDNFEDKVQAFAKTHGYNADIDLYHALNDNDFVKNLSIQEDNSTPLGSLVAVKYSLPEEISIELLFVTNKTSYIPVSVDMDTIASGLIARKPNLLKVTIMREGLKIRTPSDGDPTNGFMMPLGDRLQLDLLADIFSNDKSKIMSIPHAFVSSQKKESALAEKLVSEPTSNNTRSDTLVPDSNTTSKHSEQSDSYQILAESVSAAPIMSYEQLIVSNGAVGDTFSVQPLESGNAINYLSRAGVINILEYVVEYPDATGYVAIEKAYSFGTKYVLIVSTGEGGASCPATTYAIAFDSKTESVTGKVEIDGCSENIESLSDGNKLVVKKDGAASVFFNGEVKQATHSPMISTDVTQSTSQESPGEAPAQHNEKKKMMGDIIDDNPNARPNGEDELKNKLQRKPWQDENGFIHYPDGSVTNSPVD